MQSRRDVTVGILATCLVAPASRPSAASPDLLLHDGVAMGGYDSVAYWTASKATHGQAAFSFEWRRANWTFASAANRDAFAATPEKYAPAFNGYCTYCLADHKLVPGLGEFWSVSNEKLYLQSTARARDAFAAKADYYVRRAAAYWATLP